MDTARMPAAADPLAVVSLSGGMDSTTLVGHYADHERGYRLLAVSVDYGQRNVRELDSARAIAAHYDVQHLVVDLRAVGALLSGSALTDPSVDVPDGHYTSDWDAAMRALVVPNRNMILGSILIGIAVSRQAQVVALGMHAAGHAVCPDCRPEFVTALDHVAAVANEGFNPPAVEGGARAHGADTITDDYRGLFAADASARVEFLIKALGAPMASVDELG